jgi:hypothetical protein
VSILSSPQGTPERVWSLVAGVEALGGALERSEAVNLLDPAFIRDGEPVQGEGFAQTLQAATSIGIILADEQNKDLLRLNPSFKGKDFLGFGDWVYDHLVGLESGDKDAVLLQTYAWLAVESDRQKSIAWIHTKTNPALADEADKALPTGADDDGGRRINPTKLTPWRRWLAFLGLMVTIPGSPIELYHPSAESRAAAELTRLTFPQGGEIPADTFLTELSKRLPYFDGGRFFNEVAKRVGHSPNPGQLSPLLSTTLRNLHDEGLIELRIRGDAANVIRLSNDDTHRLQSFHAVVINKDKAHA